MFTVSSTLAVGKYCTLFFFILFDIIIIIIIIIIHLLRQKAAHIE